MYNSEMNSLQRLKSLLTNNPEIIALSLLMLLYLFLGNYFAVYQTFYVSGVPTSGGSDPYYNLRVIDYILTNKHFLVYDYALNYPLGSRDPRNPFFHEFIVLIAVILSPVYGLLNSALYAFLEFDAVFGALLIIPVYLIAKEIFGKKAGMVAALLYALMPSNLSSGILSDGRMHTPELLWAFFTIYFFLKSISLAKRSNVISSLRNIRKIPSDITTYYRENRLSTIYALLAGASTGALMLSWQGFAYIVAIILIYVFIQLVANIFLKRPEGYLVYITSIYVALAFFLGAYYYLRMGEGEPWFIPPLLLSIAVILFGIVVMALWSRPWIITVSVLVLFFLAILAVAVTVDRSILNILLSGDGYFIKTRVYDTIAEAQAPPLGSYISGFGGAQFVLGMSGIAYVVYLFLRKRSDAFLFILVFSLVSIYMSFAAARFNVTAAPAYAILGAGLLMFFWEILNEGRERTAVTQDQSGRVRRLLRGNKSWMRTLFAAILIIVLIIPSGFASVAAAVPANNGAAVNQAIYNELPSFLRPANFSASNAQFVGGSGFVITNDSTPLSQEFKWLSTQNTNLPFNQRPAFVSWWDYGFQELSQGHHPTVADDFQQGYQVAGQVLLAQNDSQIISLFIARVIQGEFYNNSNQLPANIVNGISSYIGYNMTMELIDIYHNPLAYKSIIFNNPAIYGHYISSISAENAYFALYTGLLSSNYNTNTLVNLYLYLTRATGYNIQYVGIDHGLFPFSGLNPGIFYAPTYLTDHVSYTSSGEIVPYSYYNIEAITANATYPLNQTPNGVTPINYEISYNPAFYNTTIYRFTVGYPPSVTGNTSGIPGVTYGQDKYFIMPAWNMSNFEVSYVGVPWNPYKDYNAHPDAWKIIPLSQAYYYQQKGIGTVEIFPPTYQMENSLDTLVSYYPGAIVTGRVTLPDGSPAAGVHVTLLDQYGIPHMETNTNDYGYYNLTAVPGNDTVVFSYGTLNPQFLIGNDSKYYKIHVSYDQAERLDANLNPKTGLPGYYIVQNYTFPVASMRGLLEYAYMYKPFNVSKVSLYKDIKIYHGTVQLVNYSTDTVLNSTITNGTFDFPEIMPYHYDVNAIVNGILYKNISNITVVPKASLLETFQIQYDSVFAHVYSIPNSNKTSINGIMVSVYNRNGTIVTSNYTNSSGVTVLWMKPGDYQIAVNQTGSITSEYSHVVFTRYGQNLSLNFTPVLGYKLSGMLQGNWAGSQIYIYPNATATNPVTLYPNSNGAFSIELPGGLYTIYARHLGYSYLNTLYINGNRTVSVSLAPSSSLTFSVNSTVPTAFSGNYLLRDGNGYLKIPFLYGATKTVEIPDGTVMTELFASKVGVFYSQERTIYLYDNTTVRLVPYQYKVDFVYSFNSLISSSFSASSAVSNGIVNLYYSGYQVWFSIISRTGVSKISTLNLTGSSLSLSVDAFPFSYYESSLSNSSNIYAPLSTNTPSLVLKIDNGPYSTGYSGEITLIGQGNYTADLNNGSATLSVVPGVYSVDVSSNNATIVPVSNYVVVGNVSGNIIYHLNTSVTVSVSVQSASGQYFFNSQGVQVNRANLVPGFYTVYSYYGDSANITSEYIQSNSTVSVSYQTAAAVTLSNSYNAAIGSYGITFKGLKMTLSAGTYELPLGNYEISVTNEQTNSTGTYVLSGTTNLSVSGSTINVVVPARLSTLYVNVTGYVIAPVYSPYSVLNFYNENGNLSGRVTANASGYFKISISPTTYTVYTYNSITDMANMTVYYLNETNISFNPTLIKAFSVGYEVTLNTMTLVRTVNISSGAALIRGNTSIGTILLPAGIYKFSAYYIKSVQFGTHNLTVSYVTNYTVGISRNSYVDVILSRVVIPNFSFHVLTRGTPVDNGTVENFTFTIENTGNTEMNLSLGSGLDQWNMTFSKSEIKNLTPFENVTDEVFVHVPYHVMSGLNTVPINFNYNYTGSPFRGYLNVTIIKSLELNVTPPKFAIQNSSEVLFPLLLNNTGNNEVNVTLSTEYSYFKDYGWNASFIYKNVTRTRFSVPFNSTETVYLRLIPVTSNAYRISSFYVNYSYNGINKNVTVNNPAYPGSSITSGYPVGNGIISNYTGNPYGDLYIGIIIIIIAVAGGLIATAYRGRRSR